MFLICVTVFLILIVSLSIKRFKKRSLKFDNAKILIIGGTSGLGKALAHILHKYKSQVTLAARKINSEMNIFHFVELDITNIESFQEKNTDYDFIFCCAGGVIPGYFKDNTIDSYRHQMELNYMGTIAVLDHYFRNNSKPFSFIMVASTIALFTFPGYSAYAPSKAALKSFFESAYLEFKKNKVELFIYYVNSMQTPGFDEENKHKPEFTKKIEGEIGMCPEEAGKILLTEMEYTNEICSDRLTKIFKMKCEVDTFGDYFYMIISLIFYPFIKWYIKYKFNSCKT